MLAAASLVAIPFLLMGGFVAVYNYLGYRLLAEPFALPLAVVGLVFLAYLAGSVSSAVAGRLDAGGRRAVRGTRGSALYVCGYYAGSSVFGALLGLAWTGAGWPGVAAGVGALTAAALVAAGVVTRRTSVPARGWCPRTDRAP